MELNTTAATVDKLLSGCRAGDSGAWSQLIDRYHNLVFAIAIREGLSSEDAADVTQSTFEALLGQVDAIRDDDRIASWLMTVARRQAWRVRNLRHQETDLQARSVPALHDQQGGDPGDEVSTMMWIYDGLSQLNDRCRRLLTALYFDPRSPSYAEVASNLGVPVGSIGPSRARCLHRLREILGEVRWP